MIIKDRIKILKRTFIGFFKEQSLMHGAALAYYALLAMAPILYLSITYIGQIVGHDAMVSIINSILRDYIGITEIDGILEFLSGVDLSQSSVFLQITGFGALLFSASAIMHSMKRSINVFYNLEALTLERHQIIIRGIVSRLISLLFVVATTVIVVAMYFGETILIALDSEFLIEMKVLHWFFSEFSRHGIPIILNFIVFSFIFKYLHDGKVTWRMVMSGSLLTSVLLYLGQILIKYYLAEFFFAAESGIAGAMLIILVWVYYSSQIIFFGAKYIAVRSDYLGQPIKVRD